MAKETNLYIKIKTVWSTLGSKKIFGDLKLLKSTFRAVFRTTAVVVFFLAFRKLSQIIGDVTNKVKQLITENIKLQFTSQQASAIMTAGGDGVSKNFKGVINAAREMAIETGTAATAISEGLFRGAMAGFKLKDNISIVRKTLQMAKVAGVDFRSTMTGVIGTTRAFGISTKEIANYTDVMTKAFTSANMTFTDFITSMKYIAPIAVAAFGSAKDTFIDTAASLMTLSNVGLDASKSGVYLRGTMLKLMGSSNKVTTAFAKYGVNLYQGTGAAKKYMDTMIKGQKVMSKYYDIITKLKAKQFELLISGKEGSKEYKEVETNLGLASKKIAQYSSGLRMVSQQFRMAGGQLKPFHKIIEEIHTKIPRAAEVLTKIFGVRGGAGIATLLTKFPDFEKNVEKLNTVWKESKKGKSILHDIFVTMLDTVLIKIQRIKNTLWGIFSVVIQAGLKASAPLLDTILEGVKKLYDIIKNNKDVFGKMFKNIVDNYLPEIKKFFGTDLVNLAKKVNVFNPNWTVPIYKSKLNQTTGKWEATKVGIESEKTPASRLFLLAKSVTSYFIASFVSLLKNHREDFVEVGKWIGLGLKTVLATMEQTFYNIGVWAGKGFVEYALSQLPFGIGKHFTTSGAQETYLTGEIKKIKTELVLAERYKGEPLDTRYSGGETRASQIERLKTELHQYQSMLSELKTKGRITGEGLVKPISNALESSLGINMGAGEQKEVKKAAQKFEEMTRIGYKEINGALYEVTEYLQKINGKFREIGFVTNRLAKKVDAVSTSARR